jgi:hypothetical protein
MIRFLSIVIIIATVLRVDFAYAWGNVKAHPEINKQAFSLWVEMFGQSGKYMASNGATSLVDTGSKWEGPEVLTTNPGYVNWTTGTGKATKSLEDWLASAGYSADEPEIWNALCHFYDPTSNPQVWLTDGVPDSGIVNPQIDARTWALLHASNEFSWQKGLEYYALAFEGPEEKRMENTAKAFRALGETLHCVGDMTQPCHVRNDAHGIYDPMENTVDDVIVANHPRNASVDQLVNVSGLSIEDIINNIAVFTNCNFYTDDTIYSEGIPNIMPRNGEPPYKVPQFTNFIWNPQTGCYEKYFDGVGTIPMIQQMTEKTAVVGNNGEIGYEDRIVWHVRAEFADQYASVLIPIAVRGGAEAINLFFPTIFITMKCEEEIGASGKYLITGEMKHEQAQDKAWSHEIKYDGPCYVYSRRDGKETLVSGGKIVKGTIDTIEIAPVPGDEIFVQVEAGGRIFKSNAIKIGGGETAGYTLSPIEPHTISLPESFFYSGSISAPELVISSDTPDITLGHQVDATINQKLPITLTINVSTGGGMVTSESIGDGSMTTTGSIDTFVMSKTGTDYFVETQSESPSGTFTVTLDESNLKKVVDGWYMFSAKVYCKYKYHKDYYDANGVIYLTSDDSYTFNVLSFAVTIVTESTAVVNMEE